MSHCPSCGRYVGPYEACPYCGAHLTGRVPIRAVKIAAIALATIGLAILWLAATRSEVPLISIGQAGATMNMAYVRVEGWVTRGPTYYEDSHYLSFTLADDTGEEIRVSAYRQETDALRTSGRIPALGDWVSVAGTLRVREDSTALTLNVPEHLEISRLEAMEREIGSITADDQFQRVRVQGQVWTVHEPYEGLTLITLRDASGAIDVAVDQSLETLTGELLPVEPGQSVEVLAAVSLYHDTPQLVPAAVMDILLLGETVAVAQEMSIGALTESDAGRMMAVRGTVTEVDPFSAGFKFTLDDGTGEIVVLLWQDTYEGLPDPEALATGAQVRAVGEVSVYRGELEVIPERSVDVEVLAPALSGVEGPGAGPVETSTALQIPIGELTAERVGETVTVEGEVVGVESFSGGFKFTLDDGTGQVVLVTWLSAYDGLADPAGLNLGAQVQATGEMDEYEGQLQVVPASGTDVTVLAPGAAEVPLREIGSLTGGDVGSLIAVEGEVTRTEPFSNGYRAWVNDGSGEVMVLLWDNVYQRVPNADGLVVGTRLWAAGIVEEYEGTLEVVPRLPYDVQLVQP